MDLIIFLLPKIEHFRMLGYWLLLVLALLESLAFEDLYFLTAPLLIPGSICTCD